MFSFDPVLGSPVRAREHPPQVYSRAKGRLKRRRASPLRYRPNATRYSSTPDWEPG